MKKVTLTDKSPNEVIDIVRALREEGLVQGTNFDFAYHQSKWDEMIGEIPTQATFTFYNDKYATFFILKYCK
jgi:hypothetical protein